MEFDRLGNPLLAAQMSVQMRCSAVNLCSTTMMMVPELTVIITLATMMAIRGVLDLTI